MADAKRKRVVPDDEQKGAAPGASFLQDFAALPMDTMDETRQCARCEAWRCCAGQCARTASS